MPPWEFEKLIAEKRAKSLKALRKKSLEESARLTCEYEATAAGGEK